MTSHLQHIAKKVIWGTLEELEIAIFQSLIDAIDPTPFEGKPVIIKGCADKSIPASAYVVLVQKLQPYVKSLMYGEACSSVPLYKK